MRNLIPHLIQEHYQQGQYEGHFEALTMFVDVSGFTPMTQTLMEYGDEGAEILARILNTVFELVVNAVYQRGGFITLFAGDAFTAVFPLNRDLMSEETLALHVCVCADKIQTIFRWHGIQSTPYGQFTLQARAGLSRGNVHWGVVGTDANHFFFRGDAIDGCVASEHRAEKGDLLLDDHILNLIPQEAVEVVSVGQGYYRLKALKSSAVRNLQLPKLPRQPRLRKAVVSRFLPDAVIDFRGIGEFRTVVSIFISFAGISTKAELDEFASIVMRHLIAYGGYLKEIDFGDKGRVMVVFFGAPVAHEHDIERALNCILAIKDDLQEGDSLPALKIRVGITSGRGYAGIIGGTKRCQYSVVGSIVNMAARFILKADWDDIFVSETVYQKTAAKYRFEYKGDFAYKGFADPVPTYRLIGHKSGLVGKKFQEQMIGRREELQQLHEFASPIFNHRFAGIAYIFGEAGIGKSRLAYALREVLSSEHDISWFNCPVDQILRKPFNPFTTFFTHYFEQSSENTEAENKATFEKKYQALIEKASTPPLEGGTGSVILKELIRTKSVIGAQIGLSWQDSLWKQLAAKGKYENTLYAIKNFFLAHSLIRPVVIELEDGSWIDSDSLALLKVLSRNISHYPILLLSTLRYSDDGTKMTFELDNLNKVELDLNTLSTIDVKEYAEAELKGSISEVLHELLVEKTNGNPFFVQQLTRYFVENEIVAWQDGVWQLTTDTVDLPDTINAVLMARIDRLTDQIKEVVKTAAVLGREFDLTLLSAVLKQDILSQVQIVQQAQIWEEVHELVYMFKHALLRDIAYEMQLKARLRELHQLTAETMETLYETHPEQKYADLAFHYENTDIREKAVKYLEKAADEAKAKYQNHQALALYDRLLSYLQDMAGFTDIEIDTLLKKAGILRLIGHRQACQTVCEDVLCLAEQSDDIPRMGWAKLTLGVLLRDAGKYDEAMTSFGQAREHFEAVNENIGVGRVFRNMGIVHYNRGDYDLAMAGYEQAYRICEKLDDSLGMAKNANNMGEVYLRKNDYDAAMMWYQQSLQFCEALGEKLERSRVLNNLGNCYRVRRDGKAALTYYDQAFKISEEMGNTLGIAMSLGNIGHLHKAQSDDDRAITYYERAITIARELESTYLLREYLIGKAEALFSLKRYEDAQLLNAEGLRIAEEIGDKEYISKGNLLSAKIAFALGDEDVPNCVPRPDSIP